MAGFCLTGTGCCCRVWVTAVFVRSAPRKCLGSKAVTEQPSPYRRAVETCREMFSCWGKLWFISCDAFTYSWRNRVACWARQARGRSTISGAGWGTLHAAPTTASGSWERSPLTLVLQMYACLLFLAAHRGEAQCECAFYWFGLQMDPTPVPPVGPIEEW